MADQEFNPTVSESIITQSVFAQSAAAAGLDLHAEIVVCTPYTGIAEYQGTRTALEGEGIIPVGTKWPEGFDELHWTDDKCRYWIRRKRPDGIKGPRKQFLDLDWWMLRCDPLNAKHICDLNVEIKAKELADMVYRQSAKGQAEWYKQWHRYCEAQNDDKFQAFKELIPGISRPKRGRKPKEARDAKASHN